MFESSQLLNSSRKPCSPGVGFKSICQSPLIVFERSRVVRPPMRSHIITRCATATNNLSCSFLNADDCDRFSPLPAAFGGIPAQYGPKSKGRANDPQIYNCPCIVDLTQCLCEPVDC